MLRYDFEIRFFFCHFKCAHVFRPILMEYGLFDQLRVDHGKEWVLSLYVQEKLAHLRYSVVKPPHRQTSSTLVYLILYQLNYWLQEICFLEPYYWALLARGKSSCELSYQVLSFGNARKRGLWYRLYDSSFLCLLDCNECVHHWNQTVCPSLELSLHSR